MSNPDIDESSENVLSDWPRRPDEPDEVSEDDAAAWGSSADMEADMEAVAAPEPEPELEEPEVDEIDEVEEEQLRARAGR